ncbi:MAG TPA: MFS transporter [Solirubrobacterales bacterium]|nr:MFS transporter [Solirubrobacterales bacterium]
MSAPGPGRRSLTIASMGTIVEWYDFGLYLYLAPVYARIFFSGDQESGLLFTFGVFAIAYLARPVGALVFGRYGDRSGRRNALVLSAAIIGVALAGNAAIPTESAIGVLAPILLLVSRLVAGFAIGAEYSGILSYLLESSSARRRGLVTSLAPAMSGVGTLLAVGITALVATLVTPAELDDWGWRIPVALGAVLAFALLLARRGLEPSPEFERMKEEGEVVESPVREALSSARFGLVYAFVISAVGSVAYYLNISYVPSFLDSIGNVTHAESLRWGTIAAAAVIGVSLLAGLAADRWGRKPVLWALVATLVLTTGPLFAFLGASSGAIAFTAVLVLAVPAGAWSAVNAVSIPEQLPSRVRFTGLALGYNTAVAIFGGLAPLAATALYQATGLDWAPALLVIVTALVSILVLRRSRETAGVELSELG